MLLSRRRHSSSALSTSSSFLRNILNQRKLVNFVLWLKWELLRIFSFNYHRISHFEMIESMGDKPLLVSVYILSLFQKCPRFDTFFFQITFHPLWIWFGIARKTWATRANWVYIAGSECFAASAVSSFLHFTFVDNLIIIVFIWRVKRLTTISKRE